MPITPEQLAERARALGASDAAPALGMSPFKTRFNLWQEKTGRTSSDSAAHSAPALWGGLLETAIAEMYESQVPVRGERWPDTMFHVERPWMLAHLDWIADDRVTDFKTSRSGSGYGEPGTDQVPPYVLLQMHHQMMVANRDTADVAVLVAGSDFRIYHVPFRQSLADLIWAGEAEFWRLVETDTPPDPETGEEVLQMFDRSRERAVAANADVQVAVGRLKQVKEQIKTLEDESKTLHDQIAVHMRDADTLVAGNRVLATFKSDIRGRRMIDYKAIEVDHPGLLDTYATEGKPARRLLIK